RSYGEIAAESRSMHKSQGFGVAPAHGPGPEYFQPLAGEPVKGTILDGIDFSWRRVQGGEKLAQTLARARRELDFARPHSIIPVLLQARAELSALPDNPWKAQKLADLDDVIAACAGLFLEASAAEFSAVPGGELAVTALAL